MCTVYIRHLMSSPLEAYVLNPTAFEIAQLKSGAVCLVGVSLCLAGAATAARRSGYPGSSRARAISVVVLGAAVVCLPRLYEISTTTGFFQDPVRSKVGPSCGESSYALPATAWTLLLTLGAFCAYLAAAAFGDLGRRKTSITTKLDAMSRIALAMGIAVAIFHAYADIRVPDLVRPAIVSF